MKRLIFTVTNELSYDQRMQRICTSLAGAGFSVTLIGRNIPGSPSLQRQLYQQKRLSCWFAKGKLMYAAFNIRLFIYLLYKPCDLLCAIDLDTILPCYFASVLKRVARVYDAHELFTEQKEIVTRPAIYKMWMAVERFAVPRFKHGYTVNEFIANEFNRRYGVSYQVIRNLPVLTESSTNAHQSPFIIYQGAVNEGRSFETLVPAMQQVNAKLVICGNGNFYRQVAQLITQHGVSHKVELKGNVLPDDLRKITPEAYAAVMLFEDTGLNQYYSLANRFFDYVMAGVPQVCINYPEYKAINDIYNVAYLIDNTKIDTIAAALNNLLADDVLHKQLKNNCLKARKILNWQHEERQLILLYKTLMA